MVRKPFGLVGGLRYTKLTKRLSIEFPIDVSFSFYQKKWTAIAFELQKDPVD